MVKKSFGKPGEQQLKTTLQRHVAKLEDVFFYEGTKKIEFSILVWFISDENISP